MTYRHLLVAALAAVAVTASVQAAAAAPERKVVVVVDASAGPAAVAEAEAAVKATGGEVELRVPRTPTEQLSVTHYFAVRRFDRIVGVGLDSRVAVRPVAEKYPETRFEAVRPGRIAQALAR